MDKDMIVFGAMAITMYGGIAGIICYAIYKIIKLICNTITKKAEIQTFGNSKEYEEFLEWKKNCDRQ